MLLLGRFRSIPIVFLRVLNIVTSSNGIVIIRNVFVSLKWRRFVLATVTGILSGEVSSAKVVLSLSSDAETDVVSFHLKLSNGIEINKENANLGRFTHLLQSLNALLKSHMNFYLCHGTVDMCKGIVSHSELVRRKMNASSGNRWRFYLSWQESL